MSRKSKKTILLETIGRNIRECREDIGWTQAKLAKKIGMNRATLCQIERGKAGTPITRLNDMAEAMGLSLQFDLMDGT